MDDHALYTFVLKVTITGKIELGILIQEVFVSFGLTVLQYNYFRYSLVREVGFKTESSVLNLN